ncbi:hypothetical protein PROFUN_02626 [Planoprotostelium fungivorum]|uniref:Transcription factor TFIIB cyclin-like domain-containing protein n=1 Tax=Planoprotostelium fungivorum TaxID=1890364 RepID=A0A2P6NV93_9EUKA|nr:hypothetical protein PROFUN_02626 [Planoprotostelium fungivorum]
MRKFPDYFRHLKEANGPQGRRQMKLLAAFKRLRFLGDLNNMTMPVINAGKEILERFEELSTGNYTFRGYKSDAFSLAVILLACKNMQTGHTLKELARTSAVDIKEIKVKRQLYSVYTDITQKFYKVLVKNPRLTEVCVPTGDPSTFPQSTRISTQASDLVESIINRMTLVPRPPYRTISRAREVAQEAVELLVGKQPPTVAAAAVQFVLQVENRAFQVNDLCKVAEISTNTLRAAWK